MLLGSIVLISEVFLRGMWFSSRSSRRYRSSRKGGGGQAQLVMLVVAITFAILAPILARLLYFAISRKREYLADASAVRLTRYPDGLASALEKISSVSRDLSSANKVTAPMYIINPLKKKGARLSNLTSTHPPISERIEILRRMMHGVNYRDYQRAFSKVRGTSSAIIPPSGIREPKRIPMRGASVEKREGVPGKKKEMRELGDLMRAVNKYAFLICACGLKIKVPPDFQKPQIACPRCGREHQVPFAELAVVSAAVGAVTEEKDQQETERTGPPPQQVYVRKGKGWESFSCSCGKLLQISPAFGGTLVVCGTCGAITTIQD
jgi:heat shock protein HtpX